MTYRKRHPTAVLRRAPKLPPRNGGERVQVQAMPCPTCQASEGKPCVSAAGVEYKAGAHIARRRMAVRARLDSHHLDATEEAQ